MDRIGYKIVSKASGVRPSHGANKKEGAQFLCVLSLCDLTAPRQTVEESIARSPICFIKFSTAEGVPHICSPSLPISITMKGAAGKLAPIRRRSHNGCWIGVKIGRYPTPPMLVAGMWSGRRRRSKKGFFFTVGSRSLAPHRGFSRKIDLPV